MASNGINEYSWSQYETFIMDILDLEPAEQEQAAAYNRDHDEVVAGKLSHIYQCDLIQPSGHDWISSETRDPSGRRDDEGNIVIRREFVEPVVFMEDRYDDRDMELLPVERICNWCNMTFSIYAKTCTVCEMADASI